MSIDETKLLNPGIYSDVSHNAYHSLPYVSNGYMGNLDKCPAAAKVPQEDTTVFAFGRACHCLVLEGEEAFIKEFAVAPKCDKRTKEGKAIFAAFEADLNGHSIITIEEFESIQNMRRAVHMHPFASQLLGDDGLSETTIIWDDPETGLRCKCRPDRNPHNINHVLLDLKTTTDASAEGFSRSCIKFGYARQAAWYLEGMAQATGEPWSMDGIFAFIAVEKTAPFRVEVYTLDANFMAYGRLQCRTLLDIEVECRKSNYWPAWKYLEAQQLVLPGWLERNLKDGLVTSS